VLFVPFKRRFKDKSLTGESNLGYYVGVERELVPGWSATYAVTAGLSIVNVGDNTNTPTTNTATDTGTRPAFTYGAGIIFKDYDNFQVGTFFGNDRIGGEAGKDWKYEGKWWFSLAIGYNFAR
jgi:hypothetical protein